MRLVSRDCVKLEFGEVLYAEYKALEKGDKKRAKYFSNLKKSIIDSRKNKFDSYDDAYIDITEPSFQSLGFNILEMEIRRETTLNAFVIASYEGDYMMVEKIKPYLKKYSCLYGEIDADVREYILDNGISICEYLRNQEEKICDEEQKGNKVNKIFPPHQPRQPLGK